MIIINSAAYVISEFRAEFGKIPPCLLPIGNRKLIEYQVPSLKAINEQIFLSLPESYTITNDEQLLLATLAVEIIYVPDGLQLADSVLYVLNTAGNIHEPVRMLHGDTLLDQIPTGMDVVALASTADDYNWETESASLGVELVWCGYFSFASTKSLVRALALSRSDFVGAVRQYCLSHDVAFPLVDGWHDLGHINTYFSSRSKITTQRIFNDLRIKDGMVWKSGTPHLKITAEAQWFRNLPVQLKRYTPQLIDVGTDSSTSAPYYMLEYLPISPLNEIFVHGRNPDFFWKRIFDLTQSFLHDARTCVHQFIDPVLHDEIATDAVSLYRDKTYQRLAAYSSQTGLCLESSTQYGRLQLPSLIAIVERCLHLTEAMGLCPGVIHGDLCFSNVLFDSRAGSIKLIDPRGLTQNNNMTILGDQKYDVAKLCHSAIGLYDYILAGRYRLISTPEEHPTISFEIDERLESVQSLFMNTEFLPGVRGGDILPLTILLFLSMLPLHSDRPDRQKAMLLNALRLYTQYVH